MSEAKKGENHALFGRKLNAEHRKGISTALSIPINVFDSNTQKLLATYSGIVAASKALKIYNQTIKKNLTSGEAYKGMFFRKVLSYWDNTLLG
ncbi:hypothetical protein BC937DRAFT_88885 [Endogone sp. FLAS-F59071]|nr:hypothetical protein BC937DRAFT_88885 [Endogone sp. FLAS-F59071]|eukprot:RUS23418.1 hypothetical protein BC937DRAFT_88885 [Endogone sp. FLAS-F59071]